MRISVVSTTTTIMCLLAAFAHAQERQVGGTGDTQFLTGAELQALLADGLTLTLGGPGEGYTGAIRLESDGTGVGEATLSDGQKLDVSGTWTIEGDQFCRRWRFNNSAKVCENWRMLGDDKAEIFVDGERAGLNSW